MKKSRAVPLVLIGTLSLLVGCGNNRDEIMTRQNGYASQEECKKDWGSDARDCNKRSGSSGGYVGPRYIWSGGSPMAVEPDGSTRQLSNSYLSKPGASSTAIGSNLSPITVGSNTSAASVARSSGATISRGGFGGTARGFSGGG
jgi:hypothetical protein